jgi:hypothetical protein
LTTIVDYKGYRYVGQSIIPGILQTDENNARLMYGTLQDSSKLKVSNLIESIALLYLPTNIAEALYSMCFMKSFVGIIDCNQLEVKIAFS